MWTDLTRFYPHPKLLVTSLVRAIRLSQFAFSSQESALHVAQRHLQRLGRNLRLSWRYHQHIGGCVILECLQLENDYCTTNERFPRKSKHWVPNHQLPFGGFTKLQRIQLHKSQCTVIWLSMLAGTTGLHQTQRLLSDFSLDKVEAHPRVVAKLWRCNKTAMQHDFNAKDYI